MVPNGRDPSVFAPGPAGAGRATPTVTFVGALTAGKRPDRFVEVVAALRAGGRDLNALLVGDGPLRPHLAGPAAAAGVELLGSRSDIADLLRGTDILVFPSRPAGEGLPGVLIEAGLCGVPVVATDVPGVRTIVEHGTTGVVVGEEDLAGMVSAAGRLLDDAALREAMGQAARTRCAKLFSLEAVGSAWLELLVPLLPGRHRRRSCLTAERTALRRSAARFPRRTGRPTGDGGRTRGLGRKYPAARSRLRSRRRYSHS